MTKKLKLVDVNEFSSVFVRPAGKGKYVAFGITHGNTPKMVGLTVPSTKKQLKEFFDIKF